MKDAERKRS